ASFEGAGSIIEARVNDAAVMAGLMLRDLRFLFDDQQLYARMGLENLHRGGETDNACADNREIVMGCHGSTAEVQKPRHLSPATGINLRPPFDKLRVNGPPGRTTLRISRSCEACRSIELFSSSTLDVQQFARVFLRDALYTVGVG